VLEMGLTRRSAGAIATGLSLPLIGLFISFPGGGQSALEVDFLKRLAVTVGSPPQLAVGGLLLYYFWAWCRQVCASEGFLIALGLLFSVVGRETLDWSSLQAPQPLVVAVIATVLLVQAVRLDSTWRAIAGGAIASAGISLAAARIDAGNLWFWQWHAPLAALLALPAIFNDQLAKELREIAWRAVPAAALAAATVYPWTMPEFNPAVLFGYLGLLLLVSGALWLRMRQTLPLGGMLATLAANLIAQAEYGYALLAQTPLGGGRLWLASGAILVLTAVGISLLKMGMWSRAWRWLERMNLAFGRAGCGPP